MTSQRDILKATKIWRACKSIIGNPKIIYLEKSKFNEIQDWKCWNEIGKVHEERIGRKEHEGCNQNTQQRIPPKNISELTKIEGLTDPIVIFSHIIHLNIETHHFIILHLHNFGGLFFHILSHISK
jgi:hypothetical protein